MMKSRMVAALACAAGAFALGAALWYGAPAAVKPGLVAANRAVSGLSAHTVTAAGHRVHYLAGGQGEPVVLLHGIFAEKDHWVDFARPLAGRWRVIAPDLPGHGESDRFDAEPYDYAAQVRRLEALLDALGLQRVHLAGSSMGGTIAVLFALAHPERVATVALIGAPHGIRTPRPSAMDALIDAGRAPLVPGNAAEFDAMLGLLFARRPFLPHPILATAREDALARSVSNARLWREQLRDRHLLDAAVGGLRHPSLVLWGGEDRVFDASGAQGLRGRLPHAEVQVLPGVGHLPMMEDPQGTAAAYARFLERPVAAGGQGAP